MDSETDLDLVNERGTLMVTDSVTMTNTKIKLILPTKTLTRTDSVTGSKTDQEITTDRTLQERTPSLQTRTVPLSLLALKTQHFHTTPRIPRPSPAQIQTILIRTVMGLVTVAKLLTAQIRPLKTKLMKTLTVRTSMVMPMER